MKEDRIRWNKKHRESTQPADPSAIVRQCMARAKKGRALDIAAGNGRNALFLAENGFEVDAVDISDEAVNRLAGRHPNLHPVCADLDDYDIPENRYSLIINIRFLNRRLFPKILSGLVSGGMLIFETYLVSPTHDETDPMCQDYLLRENELLHAFLPLRIVCYREETSPTEAEPRPAATLVGIKP